MSTRLFRIPLEGVGTGDVESLAGYIHRVAFEHGIYVGELLRFCHRHASDELAKPSYPHLPKYMAVGEMIRVNEMSDMVLELFEIMTGQDLKAGTLFWMRDLLTRLRGEIYPGFRWCPECFAEMETIGQQPYFKLIWSFSSISHCSIHRTPLVDMCGHCDSGQNTYKKANPLHLCQSCSHPLSKRKKRLRNKDIQPSWVSMGSDLTMLLRDMAADGGESFCPENIRDSLSKVFDHYWANENEEEFYRVLGRDKLLALIYKQRPISFRVARIIAFRLGMPLHTLLSGNAHNTSAVLDAEWFCNFPPGYLESSVKKKHDHRKIIRRVRKVLAAAKEPPSLKSLAKQVDVSVGYLEYRHPVLVAAVVQAHARYEKEEQHKRQNLAQSKALEYFTSEKYSDYPQSRKQAYRTISEETGLPKFMLKKAIQTAYETVHPETAMRQ